MTSKLILPQMTRMLQDIIQRFPEVILRLVAGDGRAGPAGSPPHQVCWRGARPRAIHEGCYENIYAAGLQRVLDGAYLQPHLSCIAVAGHTTVARRGC